MVNAIEDLENIGRQIWSFDGETVHFYHLVTSLEDAAYELLKNTGRLVTAQEDWLSHFSSLGSPQSDPQKFLRQIPLRMLLIELALAKYTKDSDSYAENLRNFALSIKRRLDNTFPLAQKRLLEDLEKESSPTRKDLLMQLVLHLCQLTDLQAYLGLERLRLKGDAYASEIADKLASFKNLKELDLRSCALTDDDLGFLAYMGELEDLDLGDNPVSSSGLSKLKSPATLKELKMDGTNLNEAGIYMLRKMENLKLLVLPQQAFQQGDGILSLQQSLSNCRIVLS